MSTQDQQTRQISKSIAVKPNKVINFIAVALAVFVVGSLAGIVYRYTIGIGVDKLLGVLDRKALYRVDRLFVSEKEDA